MTTGERRDTETVMRRSERGGWKSTDTVNSLAAYSTARSVLRGAVGKVPNGNSLAAYSTSRTVLRAAEEAVPLADSPVNLK
jgi:hypothetical protein